MNNRRTPRVFTREFKLDVRRQWAASDLSCTQLVREHGIVRRVLYRWRTEYAESELGGGSHLSPSSPADGISRLCVRCVVPHLHWLGARS
jgi:transposase-like protein